MSFRILRPPMEDVIYKPCKKCGATDYNQSNQVAWDTTPDGKTIVEPEECDVCNLDLAEMETDYIQ